ncbi:MAG: 2-oxo acid dehydrogenase subunit E2, partial [Flavobacteriaceae bacterium]|nr:2-oxo acid dehydrogenase subunit E2 [Flavobacteriaceae bacterium]
MILEMKVPSPGESITEVEIASWLVEDGDYVEKDQAIAEVDSDKATLELPAEESGIITFKAEEGDAIAVGAVVCLIDMDANKPKGQSEKTYETGEKTDSSNVVENVSKSEKTYATGTPSPAAKKILDEKGMDAANIVGTGKDGRITKDDAIKAVPSMGEAINDENRKSERKKLSLLRRKVAQRLVAVKNETAMLTTFNEVDMQPIFDLRKKYKEDFKTKHEVSLGFMSFFTLAVVRALELFPDVNSMIDGDFKISYDFADISIAVSGPKGLMVPV